KSAIERRIAQAQGQVGTRQVLMQALLQAALKHGGCLTVTQGVEEPKNHIAQHFGQTPSI
ncbi:hypothetical protein C2W62_42615, partial [Candidatus Entotheonella serta]